MTAAPPPAMPPATAPSAGLWVGRYLGEPWVPGVSDCWSLARRVWAEVWGREVPPLPVDPADLRATLGAIEAGRRDWLPADPPAEGDAVLMARGRRPCHIGILVAGDRILHAIEGAGTICTPRDRLATLGYREVAVLRREDWA